MVSDLNAVNGIKKRDVVYEGAQDEDPEDNRSCPIPWMSASPALIRQKVIGRARGGKEKISRKKVNDALERGIKNEANNDHTAERYPKSQRLGNNMNIVVSGITVSAINTVKGGNAVANSNIIIKPVQIHRLSL